jgi:tetratricopeptide (TPR) repeat protein
MKPKPRYQPGDRIGGRYQVHQALTGSMGEVYLCLDLEQKYPYALKTFQQRYQSIALRKAFEREVATWVALEKHPNIVRCFHMDVLDNQPYMVLEWITGEAGKGTDLRGWLGHGPFDLKTALPIIIDVVRGLIHAQEKQPGLVHRDLKPENILIAQGQRAKITDFGLAEIVQRASLVAAEAATEFDPASRQSLGGWQGLVGTPTYMAPEEWRSETLDGRADIYALGCILYEMLTGNRLFQATTVAGLRRQHLTADIPKLVDQGPFPSGLDEVLAQCLAKQRGDRFETSKDLLQGLIQLYQYEFDEAPPDVTTAEGLSAEDYNNRGLTYAQLGQHEAALADYHRAIELDPNLAIAYANRGLAYYDTNRYEEALSDYNQALRLDPTQIRVYPNRGLVYDKLLRYEEALADYNRAIQLNPAEVAAYINRGLTYATLKQSELALADFNQALQLDPTNAIAYANRGDYYANLRQYDEALANFEQAIQLDPGFARAYYNRGSTYSQIQSYDKALADFKQAITLDPQLAAAYHERGVIYKTLRQFDRALADFKRAIQLDPTLALAYYNRGDLYYQLQQYDQALADQDQAIELDSNLAQAYANRGNIYIALERDEAALAEYQQAIHLDPTYAVAYFNSGVALLNRDKPAEALPYFEAATQLGHPQGADYERLVKEMLDQEPAPDDLIQRATEAFQQGNSLEEIQQAVQLYPFLTEADFIGALEQAIVQQVPLEQRPAFEQRLEWLRQMAKM